jgi:hypothetical protein
MKDKEEFDMRKELIKSIVPIIAGIVAGIISFFITGDVRERDPFGIIVLVFSIYIQKFIMPRFGIVPEGKDWLGFGFLTFTSWYIAWTIMLNSGITG